jgi:YfiH family protein
MMMDPFVRRETEHKPELLFLDRWMERFPQLTAGFSTRNGGVSAAPLNSLNCALHVNDDANNVIDNRRRLACAAGFSPDAMTCVEQVHGIEVAIVTGEQRGMGSCSREDVPHKDALITAEPNIMLTAFFADCVPLYFYDPDCRAVGLAHAGWKGTVRNIVQSTLDAMSRQYGSSPEHIHAAIGPSIGACCYEVDDKVIDQIPLANVYVSAGNGKYMLDLKEMNRQFMIKAGILPMNIEITRLCTSCNTDLFFSHRREQGKTGRMAGWIALKG